MYSKCKAVLRQGSALAVYAFLGLVAMFTLFAANANAEQLTNRSATINKSAVSSTNVQFVFGYTIVTSAAVEGIIYQFCTTPLGTCTFPTGMSVQSATHSGQSGFPANGTAFAAHAVSNENDCDMTTTNSKMCFERTAATAGTGAATHTITGITAPSSNQTVYIRVSLYSDDDFQSGDLTDEGVVAVAFVNQLTINARVQENLAFCIGTTDAASADDCTDISGNTVDLGVLDSATVNISPVSSGAGGNNVNGLAMVRTNAQGGVVVVYFTTLETSSGKLKVLGQACVDNVSTTDRCINSVGGTQANITAGTENFGMTISSVDTSNGSTTNMTRNTDYDGDGTAGGGWAWLDTGSSDEIAASTTVVDDEMLVLRFAATAGLTTPTGSYTTQANFIATPTF